MIAPVTATPRKTSNVAYVAPYVKTGSVLIDAILRTAFLWGCTDISYQDGMIHFTHDGKPYELPYVPGTPTTAVFSLVRGGEGSRGPAVKESQDKTEDRNHAKARREPLVMHMYRSAEQGERKYTLPHDLVEPLGKNTRPEAGRFNAERRGMWIKWQKLGLPTPDEDTGRCDFFTYANSKKRENVLNLFQDDSSIISPSPTPTKRHENTLKRLKASKYTTLKSTLEITPFSSAQTQITPVCFRVI